MALEDTTRDLIERAQARDRGAFDAGMLAHAKETTLDAAVGAVALSWIHLKLFRIVVESDPQQRTEAAWKPSRSTGWAASSSEPLEVPSSISYAFQKSKVLRIVSKESKASHDLRRANR